MPATMYIGDAIEVMGKLPENSVDLILTSPPFLALRSYLPADHPDKGKEGGSQSTPGEFIDWLLDVVEACDRVLAPHGSLCVELGDTYSGSGAGGDNGKDAPDPRTGFDSDPGGYSGRRGHGAGGGSAWPLAKSLSLIPESFRFAMVYGFNPHTGRRTEPWRLRNVIRWVRPNPPVGALGDKFRPATSELMVFCKSAKRYFDLDAVREPYADHSMKLHAGGTKSVQPGPKEDGPGGWMTESKLTHEGAPPLDWWNIPLLEGEEETRYGPKPRDITKGIPNKALAHSPTKGNSWGDSETKIMYENPLGAPPLDWWEIPPGGYEGAHYACVDEETEALTRDGWKSHKELMDGDEIAAYDLPSDRIIWQPAKFVRYDVEGEELVSIEKEQTSQRLTLNHRMLVRSRKKGPFVKLAGEVTSGYDLPLSAPWGEDGGIEGPGTVYAAILGWFITEGSARSSSRQAYIYQSQTANPAKVDEIRQLLEWSGAPFDERTRDRTDEFPGKGIQSVFVIHDSPLARWLRDHHKHLPARYVFEWPEKDARALFDAMVDGDGNRRKDGRISFVQKDKALADAFQALAIRLGYRAIVKPRPDNGIFTVYVSVNRWVTLRGPDGKRAPIPREVYTGTVWCPQVASTFWLARRNGKPFITGNTFPPELCVKPVKAMSPERVCRTCGEPSRRIVAESVPVDQSARFDRQPALAAHIKERREAAGLTSADINGWFGYKEIAKNWERTDEHGARIPNLSEWPLLKERLGLSDEFDDLIYGERKWADSVVESTVDYVAENGKALALGERRVAYDRGGLPPVDANRIKANRKAPDRFSDCGHNDWRNGLVLDCFAGSGTTLAVATGHGRDAIGIDLDERNFDLALERVGPFILSLGSFDD